MRKLLLLAALVAVALPAHGQPQPQRQPQPGGPPGEARHPRGRLFISPSGEPFRGPDGLAAWFAQADADHDGAVTAAEFQADAERAFRLYDADGDGVIGGLEIQAYERERAPEITEFAFAGDEPRGRGAILAAERAGAPAGGGRGRRRQGHPGRMEPCHDAAVRAPGSQPCRLPDAGGAARRLAQEVNSDSPKTRVRRTR